MLQQMFAKICQTIIVIYLYAIYYRSLKWTLRVICKVNESVCKIFTRFKISSNGNKREGNYIEQDAKNNKAEHSIVWN